MAYVRQPVRLCGGLICLLSFIALLPASLLAIGGMMWLGAPDLGWLDKVAAASFAFGGPLALGLAAMFGWQAAQEGSKRDVIWGTLAAAVATVLYALAWGLGG